MVTVQEAPIVNPPETTGTSANEEPKSSSGEVQQRGSGAAPIHDYVDESTKENSGAQDRKLLILSRLKELEQETGEPEKREILRRRKKQLKEIQTFFKENANSSEEIIDFLQQKLLAQFKEQTKLEAEIIPLRLKADRATKAKEEAQAELLAKGNLNLKLQDLVDFNHAKREETLNEKKAHLDMQNIMEQHHKAKVKELEVRLELADAKLHQAELTAQEHLHTAQIEAANFKEASRLLNEMGDKYKQFEASMNESTEAFKKMSADGAQQMKLNAKMEALLAIKQKEVQSQKVDLTKANAKIIQLASEAQALRNLQVEEASASIELERVRAQNSMLQKLARTLQQEVKALKSVSALDAEHASAFSNSAESDKCPASVQAADDGLLATAQEEPAHGAHVSNGAAK
ncbi:hypothetical protein WJX75_000162 [Coccomyxa subellipsoidea]|uniref:Uncharacterized protein n=1 Tax=Coccomyxa subellipsoidea TaxID=248742 RepID=A0ABR2YWS4_9CHLO